VIMMMENLVEWRLAGETEVLGANLPQRDYVHHKSNLPDTGSNRGGRGGKPATNRLSYGAATHCHLFQRTQNLSWKLVTIKTHGFQGRRWQNRSFSVIK
jgi:hypothetical protein